MKCSSCRIPKPLLHGIVTCGIFGWRIHMCPVCQDVIWASRLHRYGFLLTSWLGPQEVMLQNPESL